MTPKSDNLVEHPDEVVTLEILPSAHYRVGPQRSADLTISDDPPIVTLIVADASAAEAGVDGADTGRFDYTRTGGDTTAALVVEFSMSGTATPGVDYQGLVGSPVLVTIPASQSSASVYIVPIPDGCGRQRRDGHGHADDQSALRGRCREHGDRHHSVGRDAGHRPIDRPVPRRVSEVWLPLM